MILPRPGFDRLVLFSCLAVARVGGGCALGLGDAARAASSFAALAQGSPVDQHALGVVRETRSRLERDEYRPDRLDPARLSDGAVRGMLAAVGDPYPSLFDAHQAELTAAKLHGSFVGMGGQLDHHDSQLRLTVARWLRPAGHPIQGERPQPDIDVQAVEGADAPLEAAVHVLVAESGHG